MINIRRIRNEQIKNAFQALLKTKILSNPYTYNQMKGIFA